MSTVGTIALIARRELTTRMFTKGNLWSIAVMVVLIVGGIVVGNILVSNEDGDTGEPVAVTAEMSALGEALAPAAEAAGEPITLEPVDSAEAATAQVEAGDAVAGLAGSPEAPELITGDDTPTLLEGLVQGAAGQQALDQAITDLGGDPAEVQAQAAQTQVSVTAVGEESQFEPASFIVAIAVISLLFYLIVSSGFTIATGVVEEKTSRIVEILLASIRPWQLLAGKIIGIGIMHIVQIIILVAAALITATATGLIQDVQIPLSGNLAWSAAWLLIGFVLYAVLWGGAASLVSRQEEIGQVTTPLMMLSMIPFYVSIFMVMQDPSGTVAQVMTYIPFSAPFTAPVRFAFEEIGTTQMLLSLGITAVAAVICTIIGGRIYQNGVLHTGTRLKLTQALSSAKG